MFVEKPTTAQKTERAEGRLATGLGGGFSSWHVALPLLLLRTRSMRTTMGARLGDGLTSPHGWLKPNHKFFLSMGMFFQPSAPRMLGLSTGSWLHHRIMSFISFAGMRNGKSQVTGVTSLTISRFDLRMRSLLSTGHSTDRFSLLGFQQDRKYRIRLPVTFFSSSCQSGRSLTIHLHTTNRRR